MSRDRGDDICQHDIDNAISMIEDPEHIFTPKTCVISPAAMDHYHTCKIKSFSKCNGCMRLVVECGGYFPEGIDC